MTLRFDVPRVQESQRGSSPQSVHRVGNVRVRSRVRWTSVCVYVVAIASLLTYVTGTLHTPIRDETVSFLVFLVCSVLIARRVRHR